MAKFVGIALLLAVAVTLGFMMGGALLAVLKVFAFAIGLAFVIVYGIGLIVTGDFGCLRYLF